MRCDRTDPCFFCCCLLPLDGCIMVVVLVSFRLCSMPRLTRLSPLSHSLSLWWVSLMLIQADALSHTHSLTLSLSLILVLFCFCSLVCGRRMTRVTNESENGGRDQ
ncbi:hypothetical protein EDD21DRAFT_449358 [Dissophora ornata]|nr:hypothetical protein EDD21DRAFT_449358 [Dissophora ornata]